MNPHTGTVFRDVVLGVLGAFVVLVVVMLPHLNPPTSGKDESRPAGNVEVFVQWGDGLPVDVDLWVKAPGDAVVSFRHSHGAVFDLLRDDLGMATDSTPLNYERAASRGLPAGEYIVNVHLYSARVSPPVAVKVEVTAARGAGSPVQIAYREVMLMYLTQEITVVRFTLDSDGALVPGSVHDTPARLASR